MSRLPSIVLQRRLHSSTYQCTQVVHLMEGPMQRHYSTGTTTPPPVVYLSAHSFDETPERPPCHASLQAKHPRPPKPSTLWRINLVHRLEGAMPRLPFTSFPSKPTLLPSTALLSMLYQVCGSCRKYHATPPLD